MVGVCEAIPDRAKACAEKWNVNTYASLPDLVQADKPDVILCAVPPDGHPVIGHVAARNGVNKSKRTCTTITWNYTGTLGTTSTR
jgi:predicted dehydrogenase